VSDPGDQGVDLPRGPITVGFDDVSFAYPGGDTVLHDVSLRIAPRSRVAIVGETGSGKSTLAKLLTRLMDPSSGEVTIDGVDLRRVRFGSLRNRVVLVPQEGFLFDASLLENIRFGAPGATEDDVRLTLTELGLDPWLATLPQARTGSRRRRPRTR
jgi:putative ABC transport system ATP-binding protein